MNKKKRMISLLAAATLGAAGTAYAAGNAGQQLQNWYDVRFEAMKEEINKNTISSIADGMNNEINRYKSQLIDEAVNGDNGIENTESVTSLNAIKAINNYSKNYIKQIEDKKCDLSSKVDEDFNAFITEQNTSINEEIDNEVVNILSGLNNDSGSKTGGREGGK